ncbi:hypothetical protein SSX86_022054 [Deinandra increscens subsp. villosa]|uniref:Tudor domain-containing protein n=1 Tax=Deinandra increscens subsp. villosa TaxID=3103831 RepID=A0AAP0CMG6_9ASTR
MTSTDVELEQQLKELGNQLSHPSDSVDELLRVLDQLEKLLLRVDQSPKQSMLDALKPSMNALIHDSLSKHSDIDVKVSVASCISEITRITAPEPPYTDDQMRDVFQLIISSFENLDDKSSRSYNKRASILDTVSKVRSCVIMLDLECDELIVKMFVIFLKSVRDFHLDSVFSAMENIMVVVIEESEEISVELLKPLLATVRKNREGVLPVAHKLGKGVLLKSADNLKPYMIPALTSLGESLDMYHEVVAAVCEGTTADFESNDDNDCGLQLANECNLEKGSVDEAHQADESKVTTSSSDHMEQMAKEDESAEEDWLLVFSNGVNVTVKEEASAGQESKKPKEDKSQEPISKEDTDDSDADDGKKNVAEKDQAKSLSGDVERDNSSKSATKGEGNSTETSVTSAKRECYTGKDEVTINYDQSLIGTEVKVWWPEDGVYYKGVVEDYCPYKKMHKISYVNGDIEVLSLKTQKWEILQDFSVGDYKGQNTKAQSKEASPEIHARLPPMVEDVLHDHSRRLQRTEDLLQWLVQLEIERARADGFPIPPLPPPPQDS